MKRKRAITLEVTAPRGARLVDELGPWIEDLASRAGIPASVRRAEGEAILVKLCTDDDAEVRFVGRCIENKGWRIGVVIDD